MQGYILLAGFAAVVIGVLLFVRFLKGRRGKAMARVAAEAAVGLEEFGPAVALLEGTGLPFFVDGHAAIGRFLLEFPETDGAKSYYFDYSCLFGSGQEQRRKQATVALFDFEKGAFPDFHLSTGTEGLGEDTGLEPVDTSCFQGFPEGIKLYGRDQDALKKFFTPEIAACLREYPGWSAQGAGRWLVMYKGCELLPPGKYKGFIAEASRLALNLA